MSWLFGKERTVRVEMGVGEALDRLTILDLKSRKLGGKAIQEEFTRLYRAIYRTVGLAPSSFGEYIRLYESNRAQWELEDRVRACDTPDCVENVVRKIHEMNAARIKLRAAVDEKYGSGKREHKRYSGEETI